MGRKAPGEQSAPEKAESRGQAAGPQWQWRDRGGEGSVFAFELIAHSQASDWVDLEHIKVNGSVRIAACGSEDPVQ